ncbi:MAG: hypothetical protein JETT_1859 [Candidatus Jettenia ecosi]|uniref:Uncharacterized protein n=1 Tax=Candidatus Jettenia ecosi TaxID=2494326 RepID=A0A533QB00_9BACT|nr:MAG: hypothetical protein JETT_1859 [Candidatus Jettenia ecosi]
MHTPYKVGLYIRCLLDVCLGAHKIFRNRNIQGFSIPGI